MALSLSGSGEEAITRKLEVQSDFTATDPESAFQASWTAIEIESADYKRIALQFPDELLHVSVSIYRALKTRLSPRRELYVLADTTYGSCCVDEVAAKHVDADVVVHYGHACLSPTSRLPVIYVFGQKPLDPAHCADALIQTSGVSEKPSVVIVLLFEVFYEHEADSIAAQLRTKLPASVTVVAPRVGRITFPKLSPDPLQRADKESPSHATESRQNGDRRYDLPSSVTIGECTIFYVGAEGLALTNLLMTHSSNEVWSYDPVARKARLESDRTNKMLMRRYVMVQKARDADVFGILVGTLGVAQYLPLIKYIREALARARKKTYTVSVGKLNPSKLANFMEIECFVLVACPENSVIDSKDFLRPIITPFELDIALQAEPSWTGKYVLDFERVLAELDTRDASDGPQSNRAEDQDQPTFSLMTGKYRSAKKYGKPQQASPPDIGALSLRINENTVARFMDSAAGEFLQGRTFQGLEQRIGRDGLSALEQGRSGIARGYEGL